MAIRSTRFVIKNNDNSAAPFSGATLLAGEPIVNTAAGIMMFSGVTSGSNDWIPAGVGGNSSFFEVGSNLYDLSLRNRIIGYEGQSGAGLVGKFLSGTTNGFVLADTSLISGSFTSFVISGDTGSQSINDGDVLYAAGGNGITTTVSATDTLTIDIDESYLNNLYVNVSGDTMTGNLNVQGTVSATTIDGANILSGGTNLLTIISNSDIYVTGGTVSTPATDNTNSATITLSYKDGLASNTLSFEDTYTTGGTLSGTDLLLDRNDGTQLTIDLSQLDTQDTYVTGFTYNPSTNTFTISQTDGEPDYTATINSVSGLSLSNLTSGRVVYVGTGGLLTDEAGFTYNEGTDLLTVGNINVTNPSGTTANIGQGGLVIGSGGSFVSPGIGDLIVHGDLTVFGTATTVSTNELYIEDPQITLNYNPSADTSSTSIASGIRLQDGDGNNNDVLFTIARMDTFTGGDVTEYSGSIGYTNRSFLTQLNDIVIRNTNSNNGAPDGKRILAEDDILDGGSY